MISLDSTKKLMNMIEQSTSPYHTAQAAINQLTNAGFLELKWDSKWNLKKGNSYYVCPYGTTVIAFKVGDVGKDVVFNIASSHIDNPGLRIKSQAVINSGNSNKLNVEVYGGAILSTWFDRPLSIAGRVALKSKKNTIPRLKLVDFEVPVVTLPNLAIHMNRKVNEGVALNAQTDMLPICGFNKKWTEDDFLEEISKKTDENVSDILSYELCVYNCEKPFVTGFDGELIMAPRIDNISSVQASITGLIDGTSTKGIQIIALFDHEEIGSRSKNGANSNLLELVIERICLALNISREDYLRCLTNSHYISLDVAHAAHPNHPEKSDLTTMISPNEGFAIKRSSKQSYCSDDFMTAYIKQLADNNNIACKCSYIRSDIPGGSTVGPFVSSLIPMNGADIGIPILAMHSAMETAGVMDQENLVKFMKVFFS